MICRRVSSSGLVEGSPPPLALLRPKRPRPAAPASLVASAGVGRCGQRRPFVVLGEAYCQLLPHWRQKCYALLWASLSLGLVTQWCKKIFTQAYKELAAVRWNRQLSKRIEQASATCSS